MLSRYCRCETHRQIELPVALQHGGRHGAGHGRLHHGVHVPGIQPVSSGLDAIHFDIEIRLTDDVEDAEILHALDLLHLLQYLAGIFLQLVQIGADDFDRIGAFDARQRLLHVVLDVLREIEHHSGQRRIELRLQLRGELVLGHAGRPFIIGFQRREQLHIGERRCIAAVVRPPVLRHHGDDLRVAEQDFAHLARRLGSGVQRHGLRHRRADPVVSLLQGRQEFAAEKRNDDPGQHQKRDADPDHEPAPIQRKVEHGPVKAVQSPHDEGLGFLDSLGQENRRQHRRHRECRDERAGERVAVGSRHRSENLPLDALHGEQRPERRDGDRGGEQDGLVDLQRRDVDHSQPHRPVGIAADGRIVPVGTLDAAPRPSAPADSAWIADFEICSPPG